MNAGQKAATAVMGPESRLERAEREAKILERRLQNKHFRAIWEKEQEHNYFKLTEMAILRDGQVARTPVSGEPDRSKWFRHIRCLEIGYGHGYGFRHLLGELQVDPRNVVGLEIRKQAHEAARDDFPQAHFSLLPQADNALPKTLNGWADLGMQFHFIFAKNLLQGRDVFDPWTKEVLRGVSRLLRATDPLSPSMAGVFAATMAVSEEVSGKRKDEKDLWAKLVRETGLHVYSVGWWKTRTLKWGKEIYLFAMKRGEDLK